MARRLQNSREGSESDQRLKQTIVVLRTDPRVSDLSGHNWQPLLIFRLVCLLEEVIEGAHVDVRIGIRLAQRRQLVYGVTRAAVVTRLGK